MEEVLIVTAGEAIGPVKNPQEIIANLETEESRPKRSQEEGDSHEEPSLKRRRFEATTEGQQFEWFLPDEMADYASKHCHAFIKEKDLKEAVLLQNPVPESFPTTPCIDDYFKEIMDHNGA